MENGELICGELSQSEFEIHCQWVMSGTNSGSSVSGAVKVFITTVQISMYLFISTGSDICVSDLIVLPIEIGFLTKKDLTHLFGISVYSFVDLSDFATFFLLPIVIIIMCQTLR